jgi:hypothetical protein
MPDARRRLRNPIDLPPPFRLVALREAGDAFAHAQAIAPRDGGGTLVEVRRFDVAEFAVVLEPEEPLAPARRAFYAGSVALLDALATLAPPEKPVLQRWPDAIEVDRGLAGGMRLAWPEGCAETSVPDWLVFGATVRTVALGADSAGLQPLAVALLEEGFDEAGSGRLVASFARHLLHATDSWAHEGFGALARRFIERLAPEPGKSFALAPDGDLMVRDVATNHVARRELKLALGTVSWLDPVTMGPRT